MACEHNAEIRCSCPSESCERRGKCCECVAHHRAKGNLPHCLKG